MTIVPEEHVAARRTVEERLADGRERCAWCLARAHARSGEAVATAGYLGSFIGFESALADFAAAYADMNASDHARLVAAVADRRVDARSDT